MAREGFGLPYVLGQPQFRILIGKRATLASRLDSPFIEVLGVDGGVAPYKWQVESGRLPGGVLLENGVLEGVPEEPGTFPVRVSVSYGLKPAMDGQRPSWSESETSDLTLVVVPKPSLDPVLPDGIVGVPYFGSLVVHHGDSIDQVRWSGLPPTIAASSDGHLVSGTPTKAGQFAVRYELWSGQQKIGEGKSNIRVRPSPTRLELGHNALQGWVGEKFEAMIPVRGGVEPMTIVAKDPLPIGLTMKDGKLTGAAQATGLTTVHITVSDANGATATGDILIRIGTRF